MSLSPFGTVQLKRPKAKRLAIKKQHGWIGVDLDGTLAEYSSWKALTHIGDPIVPVIKQLKKRLRDGYTVKIFSARCYNLDHHKKRDFEAAIERWTKKYIGQALEVTCVKDAQMIELWDDRAVTVEKNTGRMGRFIDGQLQEL